MVPPMPASSDQEMQALQRGQLDTRRMEAARAAVAMNLTKMAYKQEVMSSFNNNSNQRVFVLCSGH